MRAARICAAAGAIVILAYLGAYAAVNGEQPFLAWVVGLASKDLTDWGSLGNWNFAGFKQALNSQVSSLIVMPGELRPSEYPVQSRGGLLILALVGWSLIQIVRRAAHAEVRLFLLVWFFVYFLFFTWWDPRVLKFFIPSATALVALGALALHDLANAASRIAEKWKHSEWLLKGAMGTAIVLALAVAFAFNLVGSVMPLRGNLGPTLGPHYQEARILAALVPEECVVSGFGHQLRYFTWYMHGGGRQDQQLSNRKIFEAYYEDVLSKNPPPSEPGRLQSLADDPCVLINLSFVAERWFKFKTRPAVYPLPPSGEAQNWNKFLDWYFRVGPEGNGTTVTFDAFTLHTLEDRAYILIDRRQRQLAPRDHIARTLAGYVELHGNEFESNYPGRDRELIFGYVGNVNVAEPGAFWETLLGFFRNSERVPPIVN